MNLRDIFLHLQTQMISTLSTNREVILHPSAKGDATELQWLNMFNDYLPKRYCADKAFVLDCEGKFSEQVDVVIYDRQYSPFLFNQDNAKYVPAESVYAVFEVKQELSATTARYAATKAASVRRLRRTSAAIPHAGGVHEPKAPGRVVAGILTLDSEWSPPLGDGFRSALAKVNLEEQLDVGCVLKCGAFEILYSEGKSPDLVTGARETALIFFFLRLLARLQELGTVPAVDFAAYGQVL